VGLNMEKSCGKWLLPLIAPGMLERAGAMKHALFSASVGNWYWRDFCLFLFIFLYHQ